MQARIQIGPLAVPIDSIIDCTKHVWSVANTERNPWKKVSADSLAGAIGTCVAFLLQDRLVDGTGKGGWGKSDPAYMAYLYGKKSASSVQDSITTTATAVEALLAFDKYLRWSGGYGVWPEWPRIWKQVLDELDAYLTSRWDPNTGAGGLLCGDREQDFRIRHSERHTARLLGLWLQLPGFWDRSIRTTTYLVDRIREGNWKTDKASTPTAAYSALSAVERVGEIKAAIGGDHILPVVLRSLEDNISSRYEDRVSGWWSGQVPEDGRQIYTLFMLADLRPWVPAKCRLAGHMDKALQETVQGKWRGGSGGVPLNLNAPEDINTSCLALSALVRKGRMSNPEKVFFGQVLEYVLKAMSSGVAGIENTAWTWAVSYFLRDVCSTLTPPES